MQRLLSGADALCGEDIKFISRRIMICAAEDVGNADPMALVVATSAAQAVERVGMPEAQIILSQAVTYVAGAPKSNSAVCAISEAMETVKGSMTAPRSGTFAGCALPLIRKAGAATATNMCIIIRIVIAAVSAGRTDGVQLLSSVRERYEKNIREYFRKIKGHDEKEDKKWKATGDDQRNCLRKRKFWRQSTENIRNVAYSLICQGESRRRSSLTCRWG